MEQTILEVPEVQIIGLSARTSNAAERDPAKAKIGALVHRYMAEALYERIPNRLNPVVTYALYTQYDSDHHGEYTYIIGQAITPGASVPEGFISWVIPAQTYVKFTTAVGAMPAICIQAWQTIWTMDSADLGGVRTYKADFEVYDERAFDPQKTCLDIYVGIK